MSGSSAPSGRTVSPLRVVAVATSAGGLQALVSLLEPIPAGFPAAVLVVQHLSRLHESHLAGILDRRVDLRVKRAEDGEVLEEGTVYVASPDHHLVATEEGRVVLSKADPVDRHRPSADVLLASVARCYGERALAVVLTGMGHDGTAGIRQIHEAGGRVITQKDAQFSSMPESAAATGLVDEELGVDDIAAALARWLEAAR